MVDWSALALMYMRSLPVACAYIMIEVLDRHRRRYLHIALLHVTRYLFSMHGSDLALLQIELRV